MTAQADVLTMAEAKLVQMRERLREWGRVCVAFSGGVDSTFVLKAAVDTLGSGNVVAVTGQSESLASSELDEARRIAARLGAEHVVMSTEEFSDPDYLANPTNRCYYCKTELYGKLRAFVQPRGIHAILSGVNADDLGDFRPGLRAASEHGVYAPCADVGLTKSEIRALSQRWGLPTADKPASPCLSSRVQYGEEITPEKLRRIEQAERLLHELGFRECRVRHHAGLARIEIPPHRISEFLNPDVRTRVDARFRELGYQYVTLDLRGFRSGSMNEVIAFGKLQSAAGPPETGS